VDKNNNTKSVGRLYLKKVLEERPIVDILLFAPALLQEDGQELESCSHSAALIPEQVFVTVNRQEYLNAGTVILYRT
jgi:hypothetical protein